jgi:hypothetical protein
MIIRSFWVVAAKTEQNGWIELFDSSIFVLGRGMLYAQDLWMSRDILMDAVEFIGNTSDF